MILDQNNRCKICDREFSDTIKMKIDHDHTTGIVRGLLCHGCNIKLGWNEKYQTEIDSYLNSVIN